MSILVTGTIDLDPAKRDDFIAAATKVMEGSQAEAGCERYVFSADLHEPGRFHVNEQWVDQAAIDSHGGSAHFVEFLGAMGTCGVTAATVLRWDGATSSPLF